MAPKSEKLTDAEKKKVKQLNKAKANPGKAEEKAKTNLKRRIARGQVVDPDANVKKNDAIAEDTSTTVSSEPKKTVKRTDAEKVERQRLKVIAIELLKSVRANATIDWLHFEMARAKIRVAVKRILKKYGYPPDLQDTAIKTVLQQAEACSQKWAA